MGLFSKPEVVIAKESSNAKEYLRQLEELAELTHARVFDGREDLIGAFRSRRKREKNRKRDCRGESRYYR